MRETPNFTGWHAAILHREDSNTERLIRQLTLLGLSTSLRWEPLSAMECPDLVIVDADQGWDGLLASAPAAHPAVPVIALLGSEAPGRIAWALEQGAGAIIAAGCKLGRLSGAGHGGLHPPRANGDALEDGSSGGARTHATARSCRRAKDHGGAGRRGRAGLYDPARLGHAA